MPWGRRQPVLNLGLCSTQERSNKFYPDKTPDYHYQSLDSRHSSFLENTDFDIDCNNTTSRNAIIFLITHILLFTYLISILMALLNKFTINNTFFRTIVVRLNITSKWSVNLYKQIVEEPKQISNRVLQQIWKSLYIMLFLLKNKEEINIVLVKRCIE